MDEDGDEGVSNSILIHIFRYRSLPFLSIPRVSVAVGLGRALEAGREVDRVGWGLLNGLREATQPDPFPFAFAFPLIAFEVGDC